MLKFQTTNLQLTLCGLASSLAMIPPGGLGLSGLVHEKVHPITSKPT